MMTTMTSKNPKVPPVTAWFPGSTYPCYPGEYQVLLEKAPEVKSPDKIETATFDPVRREWRQSYLYSGVLSLTRVVRVRSWRGLKRRSRA